MPKINSLQQKIIYIYRHLDVASHEGWLKVGETVRNAEGRVRAQNEANNVRAEILWTTEAVRNNSETFSDRDIHRLLETKGIEREKKQNTDTNRDSEWFKIDFELLKQYILDYKNCVIHNRQTGEIVDFQLRAEQQEAVDVTKKYWFECMKNPNLQPEFLWNAKPRFGKTLTAYQFAKSIEAKRILIITNRPVTSDQWFGDFQRFIAPTSDYIFSSSDSIVNKHPEILTRKDVLNQNLAASPNIHFVSLQDIKGQSNSDDFDNIFYNWKEKNVWIFELKAPWDLLIIDECHEGVGTSKSFNVFENLKYRFALYLSGTPFKAIQNADFNDSQIYNWTYTDEQNAKERWNILDGENPYANLPRLNVLTYQLSRTLQLTAEQAKDEGSEYAFDLGEFFETTSDRFIYETEVIKFLDNLCRPQFEYPFSKPEYLESLRHTFWLLPRVNQCKQMKKLLSEHHFFKDYQIILAAGDGDNDRISNTALKEVKHRIGINPLQTKTITLSCGQLTTGVTVPAWTAVIMLSNCKSPTLYLQTAFRSQNPFEQDGYIKTDCYVFDFAPDRILQTIADFADNLCACTAETREERVKMLLNFLPVIAEDDEGKMKELDANEVLTIPLKLITQEVVNRGFMSNRLFDNIAGIFGAPRSVMEILEKIKPEENKRLGDASKNKPSGKVRIWVDANKKIRINDGIVINSSNGLLSDKKYAVSGSDDANEIRRILTDTKVEMQKEGIPQQAQQIILKELEKKMPPILPKEPEPKELENLQTPEPPDEKPARNEKSEEEKVRDRLRGFTRTIPSFLMAYGNDNTKLENFEQNIPDDTFKELTNITKAEFQQLRDGFQYEEDGEQKRFEGLFNADVFNASIALFLNKKRELACYYLSTHPNRHCGLGKSEIPPFSRNDSRSCLEENEIPHSVRNDNQEDIFDYIPPQETNQIFTPKRVVTMILDSLQESHPELFCSTETTFCDLYMKSGLFITETVRRLFENTRSQYDSDSDCIRHILEKQVYGFAPTDILYNICINLIFGFDSVGGTQIKQIDADNSTDAKFCVSTTEPINRNNFLKIDTTPYCKQGTLNELIQEKNMKFDVIVGNPPYQEMGGGGGSTDGGIPVYNLFVEQSIKLNPNYLTMIIPAKWMVGGRTELRRFREEMILDKRLKYLFDFEDSSYCFTGVNLDGGICYFLWDKGYNGLTNFTYRDKNGFSETYKRYLKNDFFPYVIRDNRIQSIIKKTTNEERFSQIVSNTRPYGIRGYLFNEPERYPNSNLQFEPFCDCIKIYGVKGIKGGAKRIVGYITSNIVTNNFDSIKKYKLFFTTSFSTNAITPPEIIIGLPNEICTETFLLIGPFENEIEQKNCLSYMNTNFFKILLYFGKGTMHVTSEVFGLIPLQDFTEAWTDSKLYSKYGLTAEEISFIEGMIRPME